MKGTVAIQLGSLPAYLRALDQGYFTLGGLHDEGLSYEASLFIPQATIEIS